MKQMNQQTIDNSLLTSLSIEEVLKEKVMEGLKEIVRELAKKGEKEEDDDHLRLIFLCREGK